MKKGFERWAQVIDVAMSRKAPIVIRNLPGAADLERKLLLYGGKNPEVENQLATFSRATFCITEDDTKFRIPDHFGSLPEFSDERREIDHQYESHEHQFETPYLTDDEIVEFLTRFGLDFSDDRGQPLRCTIPLCRQAEAAAKGIMGKLPDLQEVDTDRWAESLQAQAEAWQVKKKGTRT